MPTALFLLALLLPFEVAAAPRVLASILPLHSLAAQVMEGVGEPELLLPPGTSPHGYALRPSQARLLQEADLVLLVGAGLEQFLERPLAALAGRAAVLRLADVEGMRLLTAEEGHEEAHEEDHGQGAAAHEGEEIDPHLWLDPANGRSALAALAERLAGLDPANAERYRANAEAGAERLAALDREIRARIAPLSGRRYAVFHDAYRYFETAYGLRSLGAVSLDPGRQSGARHLLELRRRLVEAEAACLFREPQFEPKLAAALAEGSEIRLAVLDPLGVGLVPGPLAYEALLRGLADSFAGCLS